MQEIISTIFNDNNLMRKCASKVKMNAMNKWMDGIFCSCEWKTLLNWKCIQIDRHM